MTSSEHVSARRNPIQNRIVKPSIQQTPEQTPESWYRLRLFNYLRGSIALSFTVIYYNGWLQGLIFHSNLNPELFATTALTYTVLSAVFAVFLYIQKPDLETQVIIQTMADIACVTVLMHATGGVRTGVGMLLIINIAMSALFLQRRVAILFAAIATLAIIAEQIYAQFVFLSNTPAFTQAGLLGILIFLSAILTSYTSERLKKSELMAEEASQQLESIVQMNEHIIRNMRTGIIVLRNNGRILMANNSSCELLGCSQIHTNTELAEISPALYQRFQDWIDNGIQNHQTIQQSQGLPDIQPGFSRVDSPNMEDYEQSGRTLIFLDDATQLAQRFQQVKLASLGRLTASIAHEIRNPLAAINHAGQLLQETSVEEADRKLTGIINTQVLRLNGIVENVLQLSRQQRGTPETIELLPWLQAFREEFVSTQKLHAYQIDIKIHPKDLRILFDPGQLHQVMWNLCSNAINHSGMDAGNIMITIQGSTDDDYGQPYIDIIDNGSGIDDKTRSQIFEPFFTTSSSGTGLGLYITKEVIESNRAKIRYIAPPAGGTCFRISFQLAH